MRYKVAQYLDIVIYYTKSQREARIMFYQIISNYKLIIVSESRCGVKYTGEHDYIVRKIGNNKKQKSCPKCFDIFAHPTRSGNFVQNNTILTRSAWTTTATRTWLTTLYRTISFGDSSARHENSLHQQR